MNETLNPNSDTQPITKVKDKSLRIKLIALITIPIILVCVGFFTFVQKTKDALPLPPPPTPNLTSQPPLSPYTILDQYKNEVEPLAYKLEHPDWSCELDWPAEGKFQIILVPLDKRLYYFQETLFPGIIFGNPDASTKIYITYNYARSTDLSATYNGAHWMVYEPTIFSGDPPDTQVLLIKLNLLVEDEERLCIVKKSLTSAGIETKDYWLDTRHRDLVGEALQLPTDIKSHRRAVHSTLNRILCYAIGIDYLPEMPLPQRLALIEWALESPYWSDRAQAADTLKYKGAEAETSLPLLQQIAEEDENRQVRQAAESAIHIISSELNKN